MTDLARDVMMLSELANDIAVNIDAEDVGSDLGTALAVWQLLADTARRLTDARDDLAALLAEDMPEKSMTVQGVGTFTKHRKADRKAWDKDELLRVVLDSRVVDPETGEVRDESPLDRVLDVWNLPAPRTTALKARGIDPDEFCTVEYGHLTLQVTS